MRIVQVVPWFYPHLGGVESHVRSLAAELSRRGHEVTVLTTRHDPSIPGEERIDGARVVRLRPRSVRLRTPIVPATKRVLAGLSADVVHAHSPPPLSAYYAAKVSRRRGVPFVITYHCDIELEVPAGAFLESLYRHTFGASTIHRADRVIVTTHSYAATSRAVWRYNPAVIPNFVDLDHFRPGSQGDGVRAKHGIPAGTPLVLSVGRIVPHKGMEHLVEAARSIEDARVVIAGTGPHVPALQRLAKTMGVDGRVVFAGRVPNEELPDYYAACDVFVLPSVSRLEAFGIVALEAMACGKPVVVSDIPGVREVIQDGREGLVADAMNPEDLGRKIRALLANERVRREMGGRARETVEERFSRSKVVDQIEAVYHQAIAGEPTRIAEH